jgi:hypothetical protein
MYIAFRLLKEPSLPVDFVHPVDPLTLLKIKTNSNSNHARAHGSGRQEE